MQRLVVLVPTLLAVAMLAVPAAAQEQVLPSSNETNRASGAAFVDVMSTDPGSVTLRFTSTRDFLSCFEFRTDGDTSQATSDEHFNTELDDGLYPFLCIENESVTQTFFADEFVEVRLAFGAERDERFDWTRFDVDAFEDPETTDDCKNGGFEAFGFDNQGQCIRFVNTGVDSRT